MKTVNEIQLKLNAIKERELSLEKELSNSDVSIADYSQIMDVLEGKEEILEWILN